jgi:hypothetical protein
VTGSEASSTTADQNLGPHLLTAANHNSLDQDFVDTDDPEGISTSGQVDEGGLRFVLNNDDDDDNDDDDEDAEDDDDDELDDDDDHHHHLLDLEMREAGHDQPVAGPSRSSSSHGPVLTTAAAAAAAMTSSSSSSSDIMPEQPAPAPGSSGLVVPPAAGSSQFAAAAVTTPGFKRPFNKKGRLLETLHYPHGDRSSPTNAPHVNNELDRNAPVPPSSGHSLNGGSVVIVTTTAAAFAPSFEQPCLSSRGNGDGGGSATVTLSLLRGGEVGDGGLHFATRSSPFFAHGAPGVAAAKAPPAASTTPSVSLFPVSSYPSLQPQLSTTAQQQPPLIPIQRQPPPVKSYSESLGIGLAFSRLPGSSSSVSLSAVVGPASDASKPAVLSGPLSKRLRTRYQDTQNEPLPPIALGQEHPHPQQQAGDLMRRALLKTTQPEVSLSLLPLVVAGSTQPPPAGLFKEPSTGGDVSGEAAAGVPPLFVLAEKEEEENEGEEEGDELESEDGDEEEEEGEGEGSASRFSFLGELRSIRYHGAYRTVQVPVP